MYGLQPVILIVCVFWAALFTSSVMADDMVTGVLKREARITSSTYRLADVVDLSNVGPALREQLSEVEVGRTPRPGQLTQITQAELTALLVRAFPGITERLHWQGPAYVRVRGIGVLCDAGKLRESACRRLIGWLQARYEDVSIQMVGELEPPMVPTGEVQFRPKLSPAIRLSKRMPVWVDILVDGRHFQTVPLWFSVSVRAPALVLKNAMGKHQGLTREDVVEKALDIAGLSGNPLGKAELEGKRIVHTMEAGDAVTLADVEMVPAVSQGSQVTVYAHHGSVSLATNGVALRDGNVSQVIEVENPTSGESYRARVVGKNQARVN